MLDLEIDQLINAEYRLNRFEEEIEECVIYETSTENNFDNPEYTLEPDDFSYIDELDEEDVIDEEETDNKRYWNTIVFCKNLIMDIDEIIDSYSFELSSDENEFIDNLKETENSISYDEDLNYLKDKSYQDVIKEVKKIIVKLQEYIYDED